jgi:hypothetical protein
LTGVTSETLRQRRESKGWDVPRMARELVADRDLVATDLGSVTELTDPNPYPYESQAVAQEERPHIPGVEVVVTAGDK